MVDEEASQCAAQVVIGSYEVPGEYCEEAAEEGSDYCAEHQHLEFT